MREGSDRSVALHCARGVQNHPECLPQDVDVAIEAKELRQKVATESARWGKSMHKMRWRGHLQL